MVDLKVNYCNGDAALNKIFSSNDWNDQQYKQWINISRSNTFIPFKGAEATCVKIATEMKKCVRLKDMLNLNVLWNF